MVGQFFYEASKQAWYYAVIYGNFRDPGTIHFSSEHDSDFWTYGVSSDDVFPKVASAYDPRCASMEYDPHSQ